MTDKTTRIENSEQFRKFYRAMSAVHSVAIDYVRQGKNDEDKKARAEKITEDIDKIIRPLKLIENSKASPQMLVKNSKSSPQMLIENPSDCEPDCWDPVTQQCFC